MLIIVTLFIFAIIICTFKSFGRFITPTSVFCCSLFAACCSAISFQKKWGYEMSELTALMIMSGVFIFLFGALLARINFKNKSHNVQRDNKPMYLDINNVILIGFILFQIVSYYFQISYIKQYAGINDLFLASAYYDQQSKYGEISDFIYPVWTARGIFLSKIISYFILYWLARSISFPFTTKKSTKHLLWIDFIISTLACLITGSRGTAIDFILVLILMVIFMKQSDVVRYGIPYKIIIPSIMGIIILLYFFQDFADLLGREGTSSINASDYFGMYLGGQIPLLDQALETPHFTKEWGRLTFSKLIYPEMPSLYNDLFPMGNIHGHPLGNVYTIFATLYYDFGFFGALLYLFILSFILQYLYEYYSAYPSKYLNKLFPILFFYFFIEYETMVFAYFANRSTAIFDGNFIRMIIYMVICIPILKKVGIRFKKLNS